MRKFFALEGETEEVPEVVETDEADEAMAEAEQHEEETAEAADQVDEASSAAETVDEIADVVEEAGEEGIEPETARVVEAVMEHFAERFGMTKKYVPAIESFQTPAGRKEGSKLVLENLRTLSGNFDKSLAVAQEGIFDRLTNTIKLTFTAEEKVKARVEKAVSDIKEKGAAEGKVIKEPGWGRSFAIQNKKEVEPSDVVKYMSECEALFKSKTLDEFMSEYIGALEKITSNVNKSWLIAREDAIKALSDMDAEIKAITDKADKLFDAGSLKKAKADPSFKSLTEKDAEKVGKLAVDMMNDASLNQLVEKAKRAMIDCQLKLFTNQETRLIRWAAADIKSAHSILVKLNNHAMDIFRIIGERKRVAFAVAQYIEASTTK